MNSNESINSFIKLEIMKILVNNIPTVFCENRENRKNENSQISLSLTTVLPCKNE